MDAYGFLDGMTDRELADLQTAILQRQALRRRLDISPEKVDAAVEEYHRATGKGQGEPWEEPRGRFDSYDRDAEVTVDGELWFSLIPNNPHRPGVAGWRLKPLVDPETGKEIPPRYVQPSSAADAFEKGYRITWTDGTIREAARDGVAHSPDEYPPDWILVEEEPDPDPPEDEEPVEPEEPGEDEEDDEPEPEPEEPAPAEWEQRYGHNTYQIGDRATFQGSIYVSVIPNNSWSPADHPDGWEKEE